MHCGRCRTPMDTNSRGGYKHARANSLGALDTKRLRERAL